MTKKTFALIGASGYIAPRHMKAIKDIGGELVAAMDPNDSVGIIDSYFPDASFFTEFERFDRHLEKLKYCDQKVDYIVVCSPNYLHDAHIRYGLKYGSDVICEKPIVLNPWNLDALEKIQKETGQNVYSILQLRLHPSIVALKERIEEASDILDIELTYITSRGKWYYASWKGNDEKSGGISTNIGIHFFDMLNWILGECEDYEVHMHSHDRAAGYLKYSKANVRWFLSINENTLPEEIKETGLRTYRSIRINQEEFEFSKGFTDLHLKSYRRILEGNGFKIHDNKQAIKMAYDIRNGAIKTPIDMKHPFIELPLEDHPFGKRK